jgi:hypothetical protein
VANIIFKNRITQRRHCHFTQIRHRKMSQAILNFIYYTTIFTLGFVTAFSLQSQIQYLFNENIGLTTICKHRRLLSIISVLTKKFGKNIYTELMANLIFTRSIL